MTHRTRMMISALAAGGACLLAPAQASDAMSPERRAEHLASFDQVWQTILDRQWDPYFNEREWQRLRLELRPNVEAAANDAEARRPMMELLAALEKSHFGIIPADAYDVLQGGDKEEDDAGGDDADRPGDTGLTVRLRDGELVVLRVRDGSAGQAAGVEAGWVIEKIGSTEASRIIEAAAEGAGVQRAETNAALAVEFRLADDEGDPVTIEFRTPSGTRETRTITRGPAPGEEVRFGNLPGARVHQETRTLDGGVGYYALNIFLDPPRVMPEFEAFIREHLDAPGLVIDMRGNHGGLIPMSMGMGGWFVDTPDQYLGTLIMPSTSLRLVLNPRDVTFRGPVAVLIDETSISNAELLAAGLKDIGRARVFGHRSAGLLLPSVVELLPNGDGFQYAFSDYESASGTSPEGKGVVPDVEILESPGSLEGGRDPVLEAALEWIAAESE